MIHNHEVRGSIPRLATTESLARSAGLFCFRMELKTCFQATGGNKNAHATQGVAELSVVKHPLRQSPKAIPRLATTENPCTESAGAF